MSHRHALATDVRRMLHASDANLLPGAVPLTRPAVRRNREALRDLAERLDDPTRDVAPRGVLLAERLLCDIDGPIFNPSRASDLPVELAHVARALDPRRGRS
jgi:hypothetical protein